MMARKSVVALAILVLTIISAGLWAQSRQDPTAITTTPRVLFGDDVGIRVTGAADKKGRVPGVLVVKINGQWIDVATPMGVVGVGH